MLQAGAAVVPEAVGGAVGVGAGQEPGEGVGALGGRAQGREERFVGDEVGRGDDDALPGGVEQRDEEFLAVVALVAGAAASCADPAASRIARRPQRSRQYVRASSTSSSRVVFPSRTNKVAS